jgi:tetratricopeptide (TPR) repeat protein
MSATEPNAAGSRVGRSRLAPSQLWQVPTFFLGLLAFLAAAASAPLRQPGESRQFSNTVLALRQGLENDQDPRALLAYAASALQQVHDYGDRAAEVHFLAGSVYYRQALAHPPARDLWPQAVEHLEQALQLGLEESDVPALEYRLGWSLYAQQREVPRALELMSRSIDRAPEPLLAGYRLLADACLQLPAPELDKALAATRKVVELTDDRNPEALAQARIAHAELLARNNQRLEAIKELDRVSSRTSLPVRTKARLLQVGWCEAEGIWPKALALWQALLPDAAQVAGGKVRVLYAIGWCNAKLDTPDYTQAADAWQRALALGEDAGQAAGLRLGGLRLLGPTPNATQGLEDWRHALAHMQTAAEYHNAFVELGEARELFEQAMGQFQEQEDYEKMRIVAELYRKLAEPGHAEEKIAQAAEAQARKLQGSTPVPGQAARNNYQDAAKAYAMAARYRPNKEGFDALWHSANCLLAAQEAGQASKVFVELEALDQDDARVAEGWFLLADAYRRGGQKEDARQAYLHCMQFAATPPAARARYEISLEAVAQGKWKEAEDTLKPNLNVAALDPTTHEKSLYQMAWVQRQKPDDNLAIVYLNRATSQYPHNPQALLMRGQLAEAYRRLADQAYIKEREQRDVFPDLPSERRGHLRKAADTYQKLADELRDREHQRPLTALESVLGRRAVLGLAECHHDLGEYLEALHLYQGLLERNRGQIESLIACERIVQLRELASKADFLTPGGKDEVASAAKTALTLAEADLARMDPAGPDFQGAGVWSRQRWLEWLAGARQRLNAPPAPPGKGPLIQ